jgi:hypothetical protein
MDQKMRPSHPRTIAVIATLIITLVLTATAAAPA